MCYLLIKSYMNRQSINDQCLDLPDVNHPTKHPIKPNHGPCHVSTEWPNNVCILYGLVACDPVTSYV